MSYRDLKLTPVLLENLYSETLVEIPETAIQSKSFQVLSQAKAYEKGLYRILGEGRQRVLIVVNYPGQAFLPEDILAFLVKILEACKWTLADVGIVNHSSEKVIFTDLKKQADPGILILFGVQPTEIGLPLHFPPFKIQPYDGTNCLLAPVLEEMNGNNTEAKLLKTKLWNSLRQLIKK